MSFFKKTPKPANGWSASCGLMGPCAAAVGTVEISTPIASREGYYERSEVSCRKQLSVQAGTLSEILAAFLLACEGHFYPPIALHNRRELQEHLVL